MVTVLSVMLIAQQEPFVLCFRMPPLGELRVLRQVEPPHASCEFEELHIRVAKCVVRFGRVDF